MAVDAPLSRLFDYLPPASADPEQLRPGCRVRVSFGKRKVTGLVLERAAGSDVPTEKLKRAEALLDEQPLFGEDELWLMRFTSDYYHHPIGEVVAAGMPPLLRQGRPLYPELRQVVMTPAGADADVDALRRRAPRQAALLANLRRRGGRAAEQELDAELPGWKRVRPALEGKGLVRVDVVAEAPPAAAVATGTAGPSLNADQAAALKALRAGSGFNVGLLDGVTGSGKTEVYLRRIQDVLADGRQVLVLVPEIGLTPQFVARLGARIGIEPALLHSSLPDSDRLAAWRAARDGSAALVVGTRSAVFAPLARPGLIVVDEEHDSSFKQQEGLRYSARDLAVARGKRLDVPVILGSATPALETLQRCSEGSYTRVRMPLRAGRAVPPLLRLVDLARHPAEDGLSRPVLEAMRRDLARGGQVLVFLNRRGYAPTLICRGCNAVAECPRCDARMTVHAAAARLECHHCGATRGVPAECSECGAPMAPLGQGTQRLERSLAERFPEHGVTRIDSDSTRARGSLDEALTKALAGEAGVLVGTQMLAKGHHFPALSLVAIVNADQGLFSTDFRATERLAQTIIQVAGRAGREERQGEVIIQTGFASHPFWTQLLQGGYERIATSALAERRNAAWPPFSHLALLRAAAARMQDARRVLEAANRYVDNADGERIRVLGPVSAPMERRAGRYRAQLLFQSEHRAPLHRALAAVRAGLEGDPLARRARWSIDVDPIELF